MNVLFKIVVFYMFCISFDVRALAQACYHDHNLVVSHFNSTEVASRNNNKLTIPVVFHLVLPESVPSINDNQLNLQIAALNRDFNKRNENWKALPPSLRSLATSANIEFCLSGVTRHYTSISNIGIFDAIYNTAEGGADAWPTDEYLNVWVCELPDGILGFSSSPLEAATAGDGIVINYKYFGMAKAAKDFQLGRTLVHEVGHYLGLPHPWGAIINECEEDDGIKDTPAQKGPNFQCHSNYQSCSNEIAYGNFMDYSPDCCLAMFSRQQVIIMRDNLFTYRNRLIEEDRECQKNEEAINLKIYPNPARDICIISWPERLKVEKVDIFSSQGQLLKTESMMSMEGQAAICLDHLPSGGLFFQMHLVKGDLIMRKLIKQ